MLVDCRSAHQSLTKGAVESTAFENYGRLSLGFSMFRSNNQFYSLPDIYLHEGCRVWEVVKSGHSY